ncbi:glycosyltransferase [Nocardioides sp. TRM66260-LWL]|uniref:glycosyltransferase n=1 Tax=Nocardioides sp. TRM66260-LWL TaxID=2874478 RepID=UPI001CC69ABE|nr:glycosyltransferase [Nocardioides sp. TRM66260-LWL]MBZ5734932.1 glycosyltransferase [Nocardioides sp. TRM66260-LWL]
MVTQQEERLTLDPDEAVELGYVLALKLAESHGIRAMAIKGPVARSHGVRPPGDRSIDVDVWVDPASWDTYCAVLRDAGWEIGVLHRSASILPIHSDAFVHPLWPCEIDVHHRFPGFLAEPQLVFDTLWERRAPSLIAGLQLVGCDRPSSVLIELLHHLRGGPQRRPRLAWLIDRLGTLDESARDELAALAQLTGAWEALEGERELLGLRSQAVPAPPLVEKLEDWRLKVAAGDALAVPALAELRRESVRRWPGLIWRTIWLTDDEIREKQPGISPTRRGLLAARLRRVGWGLKSLPAAHRTMRTTTRPRRDRPRTVVMDAFWWVSGPQSLKNVERGIIEAWVQRFPRDRLILVVRRRDAANVDLPGPNCSVVATRLYPQALVASVVIPIVAFLHRADGMLVHNFAPLFGRGRLALIHDLMFETNPEWFTSRELSYFRWMTRLAPRADLVLSTSVTEGQRIRSQAPRASVATVGMGLEPALLDPEASVTPVADLLEGRFVLTVGRLNVRKNLQTVVDGVLDSGRLDADMPLVVVGERDGAWEDLDRSVLAAVEDRRVRFTGFVDDAQLRWLLRSCSVFICLSLDEGFGLPPVEALASGASVIASDISVFRETLGAFPNVQFVDPRDPAALASAVRNHTGRPADDGARQLVAESFAWPSVAARIRLSLEEVIAW